MHNKKGASKLFLNKETSLKRELLIACDTTHTKPMVKYSIQIRHIKLTVFAPGGQKYKICFMGFMGL